MKFIKLHDRGRPKLIPIHRILYVHKVGHMTSVKMEHNPEFTVDESVEEIEVLLNFDPAVADIVIRGKEML